MSDEKRYWSITTIGDARKGENRGQPVNEDGFVADLRRRTVGIFCDLEQAVAVAEHNLGALVEDGWYQWLVIEEMPYGLYPIPKATYWYEWQGQENGHWERLNNPTPMLAEAVTGIVSLGEIG